MKVYFTAFSAATTAGVALTLPNLPSEYPCHAVQPILGGSWDLVPAYNRAYNRGDLSKASVITSRCIKASVIISRCMSLAASGEHPSTPRQLFSCMEPYLHSSSDGSPASDDSPPYPFHQGPGTQI